MFEKLRGSGDKTRDVGAQEFVSMPEPRDSCEFHVGRGTEDISDNELVEMTTEALVVAAEQWDARIVEEKQKIASMYRDGQAEDFFGAQSSLTRGQRRANAASPIPNAVHNTTLAVIHNTALEYVHGLIGRDIDERLLRADLDAYREQIFPDIIKALDTVHSDNQLEPEVQSFALIYMCEQLVRSTLCSTHLMQPDIVRAVFDPATFSEIPTSLQKIAALDIKRGDKGSILLHNARTNLVGDDRSREEVLFDYITNNHLNDSIRGHLRSISLGAGAMGAPICGINQYGLCMKVLSRIPEAELPQVIVQDMQQKSTKARQDRIMRLISAAKSVSVSKVFDSTTKLHVPEYRDLGSTPSGKKRLPSVETGDVNTIKQEVAERPQAFTRYVVRSKDSKDSSVEAEVDTFDQRLDMVLSLPEIADYATQHRTGNLTDFLKTSLTAIVATERYNTTKGAIIPYVSKRKEPYVNSDGVKETFYRLSGALLQGGGGGTIGRHTRIIFSQGTNNGVRYVTIHKVDQKSNLLNKNSEV